MKIGAEDRRKLALAGALMALAAVLTAHWIVGAAWSASAAERMTPREGVTTPVKIGKALHEGPLDPRLHIAELHSVESETYQGAGRNIFSSAPDEPSRTTAPSVIKETTKTGAPPPATPAIHLRFYGFATLPGPSRKIFLTEDNAVFVASAGDIVDRRYKILSVGSNSVDVEDLLANRPYTLTLSPE